MPPKEISYTEVYFGDQAREVMNSHKEMMSLHSRVLACHCECMGMNAENMMAAIRDVSPPYNDDAYTKVMQKWGLVNEEGEPII